MMRQQLNLYLNNLVYISGSSSPVVIPVMIVIVVVMILVITAVSVIEVSEIPQHTECRRKPVLQAIVAQS